MKRQFFVTHKIRKTEIFALLDTSVSNMPSVKMLCLQKRLLAFISSFSKNITCLNVGLLRISQVFFFVSVCCKTVCRWTTTNCCFTSSVLILPNTTVPRAYYKFLNEVILFKRERPIKYCGGGGGEVVTHNALENIWTLEWGRLNKLGWGRTDKWGTEIHI